MSRILLTGLRVEARIGWTAQERATPQPLVLDLDLTLVDDRANVDGLNIDGLNTDDLEADDLKSTVDYAVLAGTVADLVAGSSRRLLEALAGDVLAEVLRDRRVDAATVTVHKPGAPLSVRVDDVAVVVSGPGRAGTT